MTDHAPPPSLPAELWEVILEKHGPLDFGRHVHVHVPTVAALRIQRLAREFLDSIRVRYVDGESVWVRFPWESGWKKGSIVQVFNHGGWAVRISRFGGLGIRRNTRHIFLPHPTIRLRSIRSVKCASMDPI